MHEFSFHDKWELHPRLIARHVNFDLRPCDVKRRALWVWCLFKIFDGQVFDFEGVVALLVRISFEAQLKVKISFEETESCWFFFECSLVVFVVDDDLLANFLSGHPHSDFGAVSLVGPHHQVDVVTFVLKFDLSLYTVVLLVHIEKLLTVVGLLFKMEILL